MTLTPPLGSIHGKEHDGAATATATAAATATAPTPASRLNCSICQSVFRRPEHLRRHVRSHTKEKPFKCVQCGRSFSRTDTLHRHQVNHHSQRPDGERERTYRLNVSTFRACLKCATARVRCSGGTPCERCETKTFECEYPKKRASKTRARKEFSQNLAIANGEQHLPPTTSDGSQPDDPPSPHSTGQGQSHYLLGFEGSNMTPVQPAPTYLNREPANVVTHPPLRIYDPSTHNSLPHQLESSTNSPVSESNYPSLGQQQLYAPSPSQNFPHPPSVEPESVQDNYRFVAGGRGMNMAYANPTSNPVQMNFDPNLLDQSVFSAINWLPTNAFDGAADEMELVPGAPLPSLPETWPPNSQLRSSWLPPTTDPNHVLTSRLPYGRSYDPYGNMTATPTVGNFQSADPSLHESGDGSSQTGSIGGTACSGEHYVDGDGARLPKYRRRCKTWSKSSGDQDAQSVQVLRQMESQNSPLGFPEISHVGTDDLSEESQPRKEVELSTYNELFDNFQQTCCSPGKPLFATFGSNLFPSANAISKFVHLYFDYFQPVYPLFHISTFDPNKCHWILILAIAAVGCQFADIAESSQCTRAMHEFLRRAISTENERNLTSSNPLWLLQAMLLNCIGMFYNGDERLQRFASKSFTNLVTLSNHERLLHADKWKGSGPLGGGPGSVPDWQSWIEDEAKRRTGYCIWLLDCTLVYHFNSRSLMALEDGQAALPCRDNLWFAETEEQWRRLYDNHGEGISLYDAVQTLYIEKRLVPAIGEFSHILLLHGIYHRTWEVADYFRKPLSNWTPSARKQTRDSAVPTGSVWLPGLPIYAKWRNSACDSLDVLHWAANGTVARASGLEHPTVLHLHAGRIVLLTPYREMRSMATSLASNTIYWGEHETCAEWQHIWRWAKHDQHKARLAIIHAGVLLWHVRRYSTNAFHEPVAVFLATLTLWAYGHCTRSLQQQQQQQSEVTESNTRPELEPEQEPDPTFFHLDRPCDDELVQLFVREGQKMQGNVTGVGDICGPNGPERVLKAGAKILGGLMNWGVSNDLIIILTKLGDQMASPLPST